MVKGLEGLLAFGCSELCRVPFIIAFILLRLFLSNF